jgi:hypothetical protein
MTAVRIHRFYLALFVLLIVLAVFYSTISAEILSVDDDQLFTYLFNLDGWSLRGLFVGGGSGYYYRPLLALTWYADTYLWGPHESFMHLENVLLHAANSLLVFFMTSHLAARYELKSPAVPLAAALLFGLHPLTTEPVNWISGRTDLLAALFLFSAMLLMLKGLPKNSILLIGGAACSFFVATLAKETALFWFPAALFFVYCVAREKDHASSDPSNRSTIRAIAPYLLLSLAPAGYFLLRHLAFRKGDGAIGLAVQGVTVGNLDVLNKLRITLKVFGFYLKKLVLPLPLNFATISVSNWYVPVGIAGLLLCCWLLYRRSATGALLLMAPCIIAPALLVPLGRMAWTPVAERYLYMPLAFVVMVLVVCVARWSGRSGIPSTAVVALVALIIAASGYVTYRRNLVWQHNLTLFQDCVAKSPDCAPAKNELARALQLSGKYEEAKRIFLNNDVPDTDKFRIVSEINRANFMAADKDIEGAIAHLEQLHYSKSQPLYDQYLKTLLDLYGKLQATKQDRASRRQLQLKQIELVKELQAHTGDPYLLYRIGQLYVTAKDMQNAAAYFQSAADKAPASAFYREPAQRLANRLRKQE